ncbi:MAG: hypothetical protein PHV62_03565 [Sulfuricurvum sp.]|nr:hypothetical protein [Sulfuricurvum sp.]
MENQYLRDKEASQYLGVGKSTIWLFTKQKKIRAIKLSDRVTVWARCFHRFALGGAIMIIQLLINGQPKIIPFDQLHVHIASMTYGIDPNGNLLIFDVNRQVRAIDDVVTMMSNIQSLIVPILGGCRVFIPIYYNCSLNIPLLEEDRADFFEFLVECVGFFDEKFTCVTRICQSNKVHEYFYAETKEVLSFASNYKIFLCRRESLAAYIPTTLPCDQKFENNEGAIIGWSDAISRVTYVKCVFNKEHLNAYIIANLELYPPRFFCNTCGNYWMEVSQ